MDLIPELSGLLGQDVSRHTLSWRQGAGGIVSTIRTVTRWERAWYGGQVLPPAQQAKLLSLISTRTGQPIDRTSPADPAGFGLGVQQNTVPKFGTVWNYLGGTLAFRTQHVYFPDSGLIIAVGLNSQTLCGAKTSLRLVTWTLTIGIARAKVAAVAPLTVRRSASTSAEHPCGIADAGPSTGW